MPRKYEPIHLDSFGIVYRISRRNWKRLCKAMAKSKDTDFEYFGAKIVLTIDYNVTDWRQEYWGEWGEYAND